LTARRDRLARLLAIRRIKMTVAARALATATAVAAAAAATATRLGALRAELPERQIGADGYAMKAAEATHAALVAAEIRQSRRVVEAEARRSAIEGDFRRKRAGVDAVTHAVNRAALNLADRQ